jgi:acyl carrier protein
MNEATTRKNLRRWILDHCKVQPRDDLRDDTPILEQGILSSLDIVEFVLYIESLRGAEVDTDAIEPDVFTSVDTLWAGFFAPIAAGSSAAKAL